MNFLVSLQEGALGAWIRESEWGYPIVLICHTVGMALVVGGAMVFAIRAVLNGAHTSVAWFKLIFRFAWAGFAISLVSGFILFAGAPQRFIAHPMFQIKLAALLIAAVLLFGLGRILLRSPAGATANHADLWARCLGGASILLWFTAIAAGRLMAYIR